MCSFIQLICVNLLCSFFLRDNIIKVSFKRKTFFVQLKKSMPGVSWFSFQSQMFSKLEKLNYNRKRKRNMFQQISCTRIDGKDNIIFRSGAFNCFLKTILTDSN